jgi:hypothetical protein
MLATASGRNMQHSKVVPVFVRPFQVSSFNFFCSSYLDEIKIKIFIIEEFERLIVFSCGSISFV